MTAQPDCVVTVGRRDADFVGADSFAVQAAADELARRAPGGGGALLIRAGTYTMYDSLHVRCPMTVRGEGGQAVLVKCPQVRTHTVESFDFGETAARVADAAGFRPGMGITVKRDDDHTGWGVTVRTVVAVDGNAIHLDRRPETDYPQDAVLQNSFPIISVRNVDGAVIEDLVADGNLDENPDVHLDGCRGAAIYLNLVKRCAVRRCTARNFNGDGISWQTTEDVTVEDCTVCGNVGLGMHPGTTSLRTVVRNCRASRNGKVGLFVCWGVRHGRFEGNIFEDNGRHGISTGHKDTDNLFLNNRIRRNAGAGIHYFDEDRVHAAHRCTIRGNVIEDNGTAGDPGVGILIQGATDETTIEGNVIRDTRPAPDRTQTVAIRAGCRAHNVVIAPDNTIAGEIDIPSSALPPGEGP